MRYDSRIIEKSAALLYSKARTVVITYTVAGALVGLAAGMAAMHNQAGEAVGALLAGAFGLMLGMEKSFMLKLEAQKALCQVQIERNTGKRGSV